MKSFAGFPSSLFAFLSELSNHNNRAWFNENKERYKADVVVPVTQFVSAMGDRLPEISDCFIADPRPNGGSMFRIYRDTRFSNNKKPYKENVGCQFRHYLGKNAHAPGFYVHLEPSRVFFGAGIWKPDSQALNQIRTAIADSPVHWMKIVNGKDFKQRFAELGGESLSRPPRGYDPDHPCIDDLKRKSFVVMQDVDPKMALSPDFIAEVDQAFKTAKPFMEFLAFALDLPFNRPENQWE